MAVALPSINKNINSILYIRITSIIFIYSGALSLNAFYIQSIGSGIGLYNGLFHVTTISQLLDIIIFTIDFLIWISWHLKFNTEILNLNWLNFTLLNFYNSTLLKLHNSILLNLHKYTLLNFYNSTFYLNNSTLLNSTQLLYLYLFLK